MRFHVLVVGEVEVLNLELRRNFPFHICGANHFFLSSTAFLGGMAYRRCGSLGFLVISGSRRFSFVNQRRCL